MTRPRTDTSFRGPRLVRAPDRRVTPRAGHSGFNQILFLFANTFLEISGGGVAKGSFDDHARSQRLKEDAPSRGSSLVRLFEIDCEGQPVAKAGLLLEPRGFGQSPDFTFAPAVRIQRHLGY